MLPRQLSFGLDVLEASGLEFLACLGFTHLVKAFDRNLWILESVLDENDPSAWSQGLSNRGEHFPGM